MAPPSNTALGCHDGVGRLADCVAGGHCVQERMQALRQELQEREVLECTFRPSINAPSPQQAFTTTVLVCAVLLLLCAQGAALQAVLVLNGAADVP